MFFFFSSFNKILLLSLSFALFSFSLFQMFFLSIVHHRIERSNHPLLNKFGKLFFFLSRTRLESVLILFANPMLSRLLFIATFSFHSRKLVVAKFTLSYWTWNMSFHPFLIHLCKRGTRASGYLTSLAFFKPDLSFNYTSQHVLTSVLKTFYFLHDQCNCPYLYMLLKKKKKSTLTIEIVWNQNCLQNWIKIKI